jgi:hypothetical protein
LFLFKLANGATTVGDHQSFNWRTTFPRTETATVRQAQSFVANAVPSHARMRSALDWHRMMKRCDRYHCTATSPDVVVVVVVVAVATVVTGGTAGGATVDTVVTAGGCVGGSV